MSFTQPICEECWWEQHASDPARLREDVRDDEICAFCGRPTFSGIYVRVDPSTVPFPQGKVSA